MEMLLRHQKIMLALRQEMGWPAFKPVNDALAFMSGKPFDLQVGMELARIVELVGKDGIYTGWASSSSVMPTGFSIAYRELLTVDVIANVLPYAASDAAPIMLVKVQGDEHFYIDRRGSLTRQPGRPKALGAGRRLAVKRIKAAAAEMGDDLLAGNRHVPWGATEIQPDAVFAEAIVRFS